MNETYRIDRPVLMTTRQARVDVHSNGPSNIWCLFLAFAPIRAIGAHRFRTLSGHDCEPMVNTTLSTMRF